MFRYYKPVLAIAVRTVRKMQAPGAYRGLDFQPDGGTKLLDNFPLQP